MGKTLSQILMDEARQTDWFGWMEEVSGAVRHTEMKNAVSWKLLERLSWNEENMPRLVDLLKVHCPCPSYKRQEEAAFLILAAYHNDNESLGYVIDTMNAYMKEEDLEGILFLARMQAIINENDCYPHLNSLYNQLVGYAIREYKMMLECLKKGAVPTYTGSDFRRLEKYLPHFRHDGFTYMVLQRSAGVLTGKELAKRCHMSETVFRERFRDVFGITVSEWLHKRRKDAVEKMLENPNIPLTEVAEANGFKSLSTLSDYCKRNLGCSPLFFRKNTDKNAMD